MAELDDNKIDLVVSEKVADFLNNLDDMRKYILLEMIEDLKDGADLDDPFFASLVFEPYMDIIKELLNKEE
jgi:hypothetical protein